MHVAVATRTEHDYGDLVAEHVADAGGGTWQIERRETWTYATPDAPDAARLNQGWKLHLSATVASATEVLRRSVPVLVAAEAPFKVASTVKDLATLNSSRCPRPSSGKFITVYPGTDDQAVALAAELDKATAGLAGPAILSDRRYHPTSLVHYRYGAFRGVQFVSNNGELVHAITRPDGTLVEDQRAPRFTPPEWVKSPFPETQSLNRAQAEPAGVLLGGRFLVRQAVRHANKGGVFRALDQDTGEDVVVKQARAHVGGDERGLDAGHLLANEVQLLGLLESRGVTFAPRLVASFQQGGDSFLAEEAIAGVTLRAWNDTRWADTIPSDREAVSVARKVAEILSELHRFGVVVRDFTPNNLIVQPDGEIRVIDLELAVPPTALSPYQPDRDPGRHSLTPAYGAPEQPAGARPAPSADCFALGAILCLLFTGEDPYIDPESPSAATTNPVAAWLASGRRTRLAPAGIRQLVLALTDPDPAQRPSAALAAAILRRREQQALAGNPPPSLARLLDDDAIRDLHPLADETIDLVIADALAAIRESARAADDRYWPATPFGLTTDPRNVQHGAAGVIGALVQAWRATGDHNILDVVDGAASWLARRVDETPSGPVGIHFGTAGQAWSLVDAGRALGDDRLLHCGVELALRLPPDWPGPDVTHGRAGLGLTLLHLYDQVGDERLLAAAGRCADSLLHDTERNDTERNDTERNDTERNDTECANASTVAWRTPAGFPSTFAGRTFYGFAHGTAGIATFLLAMAAATGRDDCRAAASQAAATLAAVSIRRDALTGWGEGPESPATLMPHWCNGASGVGSFLVRWWQHSEDSALLPLVHGAARTVMSAKWQSGIAYCHGLAGNGDFLLDVSELLGEDRYRIWAADLAAVLFERRVIQHGRVAFGDQPGPRTPDFNVGLAGVLSFFIRLRHGGPRLWMVNSAERRG